MCEVIILKFETVIGIEVHCELKTKSKMFSSAPVSFGKKPNTQVHAIDLAMPGTLPSVNQKAVEMAIRVCHALHMDIQELLSFDRKNYFYADLPKGYQITQHYHPIGSHGYIEIDVNQENIRIDIERLHLEEDTAKLTHLSDESLIDYNRAGIPLIEIVSKPQIKNSLQACAYLEALRSLFIYTDVSDAVMAQGSMRCDINISLKPETSQQYGVKVEIKNLNSLSNVQKAIDYEIQRQTALLLDGKSILQQTRRFDEKTQTTVAMRNKETTADYRYYPEPNILPIKLDSKWIQQIKDKLPLLPKQRKDIYINQYQLSYNDARILIDHKELSDFYNQTVQICPHYQLVCHWLIGDVLSYLNKSHQSIHAILHVEDFAKLMHFVAEKTLSTKQAKQVLELMMTKHKDPVSVIEEYHFQQINDDHILMKVIDEILDYQPDLIKEYSQGKTKIVGFLVGQVMQKTNGQVNPQKTNQLLMKELEKRKQ